MYAIFFVGFVTVALAYQAKFFKYHICLLFSFVVLGTFLAVRYDFGNDYMPYMLMHKELQNMSIFNSHYEFGWIILNKFVYNFYLLVSVLSIFNCYVYFRFINRYVPLQFWWLAVFIYVFNTNFMLIQASAMRQTVAILVFIYSIKYIINRNFGKYFIACLIASAFHSSAILLLPVYWIGSLGLKSKFRKVIIVCAFISLYISGHYLLPVLRDISFLIFNGRYDHFFLEKSESFLLNACVYTIVLILLLSLDRKLPKYIKIFNRISILALFFFPISSIFPMAARVGYYFFPATLVTYPYIAKSFEVKLYGKIFVVCLISIIIIRFFSIVTSDIWRDHFIVYKTIFNI